MKFWTLIEISQNDLKMFVEGDPQLPSGVASKNYF